MLLDQTLTDGVVTLRALRKSDCVHIAALLNNARVVDNLRDMIPFPYTVEHAVAFFNHIRREPPGLTFVVEWNEQACGIIGLTPQSDVYRLSAELGYWLGEPYWGNGLATRSVKLVTDFGFKTFGWMRIYSGVFGFNVASIRVLEKAGFELEGVFRRAVIKKGVVCDEYRYALLR